METAKKIKIMVEKLTEDDILFVLISGGGSGIYESFEVVQFS